MQTIQVRQDLRLQKKKDKQLFFTLALNSLEEVFNWGDFALYERYQITASVIRRKMPKQRKTVQVTRRKKHQKEYQLKELVQQFQIEK